MKLLVAEDDLLLGQATCKALKQLGFAVDWLTSGSRVSAAVGTYTYDCILLDLGLPDMTGEQCLKALRKSSRLPPVIVLTARGEPSKKVEMLDLGADDYLVKPFDTHELAARIRAVARRAAVLGAGGEVDLVHGHLRLNPASRSVTMGDEHQLLTNKEFSVLEALVRHRGRIVTRHSLQEALYGWDDECSTNAIEVFVCQLRRKLGAGVVKTVRGMGYRIASASELSTLEALAKSG